MDIDMLRTNVINGIDVIVRHPSAIYTINDTDYYMYHYTGCAKIERHFKHTYKI